MLVFSSDLSRRCAALRCAALRCAALRCAALRCAALRCAALRCAALRCAALRCAALRQIVVDDLFHLYCVIGSSHCNFTESHNYDPAPVASVTPLAQPVANNNVLRRLWGGGVKAILVLIISTTLAVVYSPSPVSGMPLNLKLPLREYCSTQLHSPSSRSTLSSRAIIFFLLSSWDVRPAIVRVTLSSLSDSACGYKADHNVLNTPSSFSSSTNLFAIIPVSPTSLSVTLEGFRAFGMFFSRNYLPHKSAVSRHGSHLGPTREKKSR